MSTWNAANTTMTGSYEKAVERAECLGVPVTDEQDHPLGLGELLKALYEHETQNGRNS